jgi:hypothetical protein
MILARTTAILPYKYTSSDVIDSSLRVQLDLLEKSSWIHLFM